MRNPRIFVTLDPDLADAVRRIGLGSGMSQSAVIGHLLDRQRDALLSLADAMDKARAISGPLSGALAAVLGKSDQDLDAMEAEAMGKLDELHLVLDQAIEDQGAGAPARRPQGERAGAAAAHSPASRPPLINKGAKEGGYGSSKPK